MTVIYFSDLYLYKISFLFGHLACNGEVRTFPLHGLFFFSFYFLIFIFLECNKKVEVNWHYGILDSVCLVIWLALKVTLFFHVLFACSLITIVFGCVFIILLISHLLPNFLLILIDSCPLDPSTLTIHFLKGLLFKFIMITQPSIGFYMITQPSVGFYMITEPSVGFSW